MVFATGAGLADGLQKASRKTMLLIRAYTTSELAGSSLSYAVPTDVVALIDIRADAAKPMRQ